jgi:hypothetical protein
VGVFLRAGRLVALTGMVSVTTACSLSVLDGLSGGLAPDDAGTWVAGDAPGAKVKDASVDLDALPRQEASVLYDDGSTAGSTVDLDAATNDGAIEVGCPDGCPGRGYCVDSQCVYASCKDRLAALPDSVSGVYSIDPDLSGNDPPFRAFCAMRLAGGGWTLLMKIDGHTPTFEYDSPLWEDSSTFQSELADFDMNEAKLQSYVALPFATLLIGMRDESGTRWTELTLGGSSLRDLMATKYHPTALGRAVWEQLPGPGSLQLYCNLEGVNVVTPQTSVRLGIVANEQNDCLSCDSFIGFGAQHFSDKMACGNIARFSPDHGDRVDPDFGYIMAR